MSTYRGRLAPTPTGDLHSGHARTFYHAWKRARDANGRLFLRMEDLDTGRCKPRFARGILEDLKRLGLNWDGEPEYQSQHPERYLHIWRHLKDQGSIYPCTRSRKEIQSLPRPPQEDEQDAEPIVPPEWRPSPGAEKAYDRPGGVTWRFRVPDGEVIRFTDALCGEIALTAGRDFGDFSVWRRDNIPSYELSVVVDDIHQKITEVVRGRDLLTSTARQLLLYRALKTSPPSWCHQPLVRDASGKRLSKRFHSRSVRSLLDAGTPLEDLFY
ncbi:MAG: glutamate--tRNA ligase family protein [Kiritimatiellia bacterium]